ncbi:MFS transporter [Pontitalea aquivivens]|uniref:MFS transporter n=1 Tax=Pontitalea aquivivens TaxID=3388663 RepID=UPI003970AAB6
MNDPRRLSLPEFTAMLAMLFATIAFSIDAMLPALPRIGAELSPDAINRAQLILTAFMLGMGFGTFLAGPISDAVGRKATITAAFAIYIGAAIWAVHAQTLDSLLAARFVQGLGAAGPRIVSLALVRDLYKGREMARVTSIVMMIFILVPAIAPSLGQLIMGVTGWRGIFWAFVIFAALGMIWLNLRQPETLPRPMRRPLRPGPLWAALREVLAHPEVRLYTLVMTLGYGQMFALLSAAPQLFAAYGQGPAFAQWFALMALLSGAGTVLNARFVVRLGMRRIVIAAYRMQVIAAGLMLAGLILGLPAGAPAFAAVFVWSVSLFFMAGVTFGNLNALAMQQMGHIAGMAASVVSAVSTVLAVALAAPIGLAFSGTATPLVLGALICSGLAWALMRRTIDTN